MDDIDKTVPRPRPWARLAGMTALLVLVLGSAGAIQTSSMIAQMQASLPPTPVVASLPVSTAVVDRTGQIGRAHV